MKDMCNLCNIIQRINNKLSEKKPWFKTVDVLIDGKVQTLELIGVLYQFKDGIQEVVRQKDDETIIVNKPNPYSLDVVIAMPKEHYSNQEIIENGLSIKLDKSILRFIKEQYQGNARVLQNYGPRYASVEDHAHKQVIVSEEQNLILPPWGFKGKLPISDKEFQKAFNQYQKY